MNIQDALKETGKVSFAAMEGWYAEKDCCGILQWYDARANNLEQHPVYLDTIVSNDWQPYHEVKEIKPEKAGELWQRDDESSHRCLVYGDNGILYVMWWGGDITPNSDRVDRGMIHNKNGWTRLFPPIEDGSAEKIEIEGVQFLKGIVAGTDCIYPTSNLGQFSNATFDRFTNKPPMKMILEIPKD